MEPVSKMSEGRGRLTNPMKLKLNHWRSIQALSAQQRSHLEGPKGLAAIRTAHTKPTVPGVF